MSFPDIEILENLAQTLEVSVTELLKSEKIEALEPDTVNLIKDTLKLTKDENKKNKKKSLIIFSFVIFVFILIVWLLLYLTTPKYDKSLSATREYIIGASNIKGEVDTAYFLSKSPNFAIGATANGMAVFKNPDKAFERLIKDYQKGLNLIKNEYCKKNISKRNFLCYKNLGWQVTIGTKEEQEEAMFISQVLCTYESSFNEETIFKMMHGGIHFYF